MNRDDITRMARQAGLHLATDVNWMPIIDFEYAEKFAALVAAAERKRLEATAWGASKKWIVEAVAAEREAIAKMFDGKVWAYDYREIAAAIRARGQA